MPDVTRTFIDKPSTGRPSSGNRVTRLVIQAIVSAIVLISIVVAFQKQWTKFRGTSITVEPRWGIIALACVVMLATYGVLIETWRRIILAWGDSLSFDDAARIWSLSNLARYLPGNTFIQVGVVARLAQGREVSPTAAAGGAAINTVVNIATGFVVALATGWSALQQRTHGRNWIGIVVAIVLLAGLLSLPSFLPRLIGAARRVTGRNLVRGDLPRRAIYVAVAGNVIAWLMYGAAFQLFVLGVVGTAAGSYLSYVAVYSWAYVIGYLAFWLPAGLGARDGAQMEGLSLLSLATPPQAVVIAVCARLWTTILELLPAVFYLVRGTRPRPQAPTSDHGQTF